MKPPRKPGPALEGARPASHRHARGNSPAGRPQAPRHDRASDCLDSVSVLEADRYSRGLLQSRADIVSSHAKPSLRKRPAVSGVADRNATRRRRRSYSHAFVDDPRGARYPRGRDTRRRPGVTLVRGSVRMPDRKAPRSQKAGLLSRGGRPLCKAAKIAARLSRGACPSHAGRPHGLSSPGSRAPRGVRPDRR